MPLRWYDPVFRDYIRRESLESEARNIMKMIKLIIEPGDPEWYEQLIRRMKESQKDWML